MSKILAVEDDKLLLEFLTHCLATEGHMVVPAADGRTAMNWIKSDRFDLALLDLHLPDMHGLDICAALKGSPRTSSTPLIVLTGDAANETRIRSRLETGADLFLTKPIEPRDLRTAVKRLIENAARRPQRRAGL